MVLTLGYEEFDLHVAHFSLPIVYAIVRIIRVEQGLTPAKRPA